MFNTGCLVYRQISAMAEDVGWEPVEPKGLALGTYATTVILSVLCTIVVLMRTFVRARNRCLGTDDHLMVAGWVSQPTLILFLADFK